MGLEELFPQQLRPETPGGQSHSNVAYAATVNTTPTDHEDDVYVVIPAIDSTLRHGPVKGWPTRGIPNPAKGDECLIVFDEAGEPWFVAWRPADFTGIDEDSGGSGATDLDGLTDVDLTGLGDGDTLVYDAGSSTFVPGEGGGMAEANDYYDSVTAVASGASTTVVDHTAGGAGYKVLGMSVTGNGDALFELKVDGLTKITTRINQTDKSQFIALPSYISVSSGDVAEIVVTNESLLSCDYEATLLGE